MPNQSLSLSQEQRQIQILAPQLRQSLELLQVPMLELRALIQNELQQNPILEEIPPDTTPIDIEPGGGEVDDAKELNFEKEFEILSRIDEEWYNYFTQQRESESYDPGRQKKRSFFFDSHVQQESLQDHLIRQLGLSDLSKQDRQIGELIIGSINDDGYLVQSLEELAESSGIDRSHTKDILLLIQEFDPIGIAARDLKECLLLQLERLGQEESLAASIVRDHLEPLGDKHFKEIAHALKVSIEDVQRAANMISTLEPKPGRAFGSDTPTYILPDVVVEKINGNYMVLLNDEQIPHLRISRNYRQLMSDAKTTPEVKEYINNRIRSGLFLMKSIEQRKHTLRNVAGEIVKVQTDFLDSGITCLRPLTMAQVAKKVSIHETTVCRCIANKYMRTPHGTFEMKYFFTPGIKTANGQAVSNKTVQDMISSIVAEENSTSPLSDHDIVKRLREQGMVIARRTVAKYRLALRIPPAHLRKSA